MLNFSNYQISLNINPVFLILVIPLIGLFVWYIYKYTIPQTSPIKKYLLITTRSIALLLILLLIFDPSITETSEEEQKALIPVFIDNSASISYESNVDQIRELVTDLSANEKLNYKFYSFGNGINELNIDLIDSLIFNSTATNIEQVFSQLNQSDEFISSTLLITDGIINDGSSSIYQSNKLKFPIYSIGVGDTSKITDLYVSSVLSNRFLYQDTETIIAAEISNRDLDGESITVSLLENNKVLRTKNIELDASGYNRVVFDYLPKSAGKQKITIQTSTIEDEDNFENNSRSKFVDVLKNKLNILIVSGTPSADLRALNQTLMEFDEYEVNEFVQINETKQIGDDFNSMLDSAQVLVLVDFPISNTKPNLIANVSKAISEHAKPVLFINGSNLQLEQFKKLEEFLPVSANRSVNEIYLAQPKISSTPLGIINSDEITGFDETDLPPVSYTNFSFQLKPGSNLLASAKINNVETQFPLIAARNEAGKRSIALLAGNIWRWKISPNEKSREFFSKLIRNAIQWLRVTANRKTFFVETNKDIFASGENIKFNAELYDDKLEPISNAEISVDINSQSKSYNVKLAPQGEGLYNGEISITDRGDATFRATARVDGLQVNQASGRFNIGEIDLEKLQTVMQSNYLRQLAINTGGEYQYINNSSALIDNLENSNKNKSKVTTSSITINLLSSEILLLLIIIILSIEWFIRKREGML